MNKLIIFIPSIESAGVEKNLFYLSNYLIKRNVDVNILTANNNKKNYFNKKINFICPRSNKWNNSSRLIKTLICLYLFIINVRKNNISFLSFQSNIAAIILSKFFRLKIIIRLNTSLDKYIKNIFKKFIFKFFYNLSNNVIVNSFDFKKELISKLNLKSIEILNPIKIDNKIRKKRIKFFNNFNGIKILSIGRLTDQKNQITILKSLNILKKQNIKFKFFLIGQGYKLLELKKFIKKNKLSKDVKLAGYKSKAYEFISSSDLFVLSSKYEGLPNVLIEAQVQKIPIISSDCNTGPREILLNGKLGTLYKVDDHTELSKTIIKFYKDKKIFLQKAKLAQKYLFRYDYENNLNKYYKTIKTIL